MQHTLLTPSLFHRPTASKAIDVLMQSKFANADHKEFIFPNRYSCTDFMASLVFLCMLRFNSSNEFR